MNIVGKILVVLNLVFALATGGFLAVDYVTRTNWKDYGERLKRELEVARANSDTSFKTRSDFVQKVKKAESELETEKQNRKNDAIVIKIQLDDAIRKAEDADLKAKEADLAGQRGLAEINRLKEENKGLAEVIKQREKAILAIEEENRDLRNTAVSNENKFKAAQTRNESLLERIMEMSRQMAQGETKTVPGVAPTDPSRANPPPVYVKGIIEKVDAKDGLVEISIGSDQGIKKYHTLEVYRLNPRPEYLGTIRIVDVFNRKAIGRRINAPTSKGPLHEGDQVASTLSR